MKILNELFMIKLKLGELPKKFWLLLIVLFGIAAPYIYQVFHGVALSEMFSAHLVEMVFQFWMALPYLIIVLVIVLAKSGNRTQTLALISAIAVTGIGALGFLSVVLNPSDMAPLGLLPVPVVQLLAILIIFGAGRLSTRSSLQ